MKSFKISIIAVVLVGFVAGGLFTITTSRGQSQASKSEPVAAKAAPAPVKSVATSSSFAATRNAELRNDLSWAFGRKAQRGWYLYDSLLSSLLGTDHAPQTDIFAKALQGWQKKKGLGATGILDETTLYAIVAE
ncbi:MAG TPA: hypothetical protein VJV03_14785, partial [Pyrinomonadaceae bacterium]|nr:hypothetical protein [Pyrinomonadaceae bacterium]